MTKNIITVFALAALTLTSCAQSHTDAPAAEQPAISSSANAAAGRALFLKNCAHCHGADARGDDGPDLHSLDWTNEQIAARIRNGRKGQMTAFAGKLQPADIDALVQYLRTLK